MLVLARRDPSPNRAAHSLAGRNQPEGRRNGTTETAFPIAPSGFLRNAAARIRTGTAFRPLDPKSSASANSATAAAWEFRGIIVEDGLIAK